MTLQEFATVCVVINSIYQAFKTAVPDVIPVWARVTSFLIAGVLSSRLGQRRSSQSELPPLLPAPCSASSVDHVLVPSSLVELLLS